jgi:hypothetical protein
MAKKASARRHKKRVAFLSKLFAENADCGRDAWFRLVNGWLAEVRFRAHAESLDTADQTIPAIFGVYREAKMLAEESKIADDPHVVATLNTLQHVSAVEVSRLTDIHLYGRLRKDSTSRLREMFVKNRSRD